MRAAFWPTVFMPVVSLGILMKPYHKVTSAFRSWNNLSEVLAVIDPHCKLIALIVGQFPLWILLGQNIESCLSVGPDFFPCSTLLGQTQPDFTVDGTL